MTLETPSMASPSLLSLPTEILERILHYTLTFTTLTSSYPYNHNTSNTSLTGATLLRTCTHLHHASLLHLHRSHTFVHLSIHNHPVLARWLWARLPCLIYAFTGQRATSVQAWKGFSLSLSVKRPILPAVEEDVKHFVVVGQEALKEVVRALSTCNMVYDLVEEEVAHPEMRMLGWEVVVMEPVVGVRGGSGDGDGQPKDEGGNQDASEARRKHTQREEQLLAPFFEYWCNGYMNVSVEGVQEKSLARKLKTVAKKDKWASADDYVTFMTSALEAGKAALDEGGLLEAHSIWRDAEDMWQLTSTSSQHRKWLNKNALDGAASLRLMLEIWRGFIEVSLRLAEDPATIEKRQQFAHEALRAGIIANECAHGWSLASEEERKSLHEMVVRAAGMSEDLEQSYRMLESVVRFHPREEIVEVELKRVGDEAARRGKALRTRLGR